MKEIGDRGQVEGLMGSSDRLAIGDLNFVCTSLVAYFMSHLSAVLGSLGARMKDIDGRFDPEFCKVS